jgi:hypothetical protein
MDAKLTLSLDSSVIDEAKKFAESHNISLSRLTEFLLRKTSASKYYSLDDLPVSDWVNMVAEGQAEYSTKPKTSKSLKKEYLKSR